MAMILMTTKIMNMVTVEDDDSRQSQIKLVPLLVVMMMVTDGS